MPNVTPERIRRAYETAKAALLAEMVRSPVAPDDPVQKLLDEPVSEFQHWVGKLSTSALSTATAVMALERMRRQYVSASREVPDEWLALIRGGINWLIAHQNEDGGWGDTVKSLSNISTTMLCHAVLRAVESRESRVESSDCMALGSAQAYITKAGGVPALIARYGKDRTFSVPILTHCALAGLIDWDEVIPLPFELAAVPAKFYAAVRMPVVSYALPALIAIGQVRFHFRPPRNPLVRWLRKWVVPRTLAVLERIQPTNGGFLEATPLTSFVTMSLAAMGLIDHPVTRKGIEFIVKSARRDVGWDSVPTASQEHGSGRSPNLLCSWPIDTNLATWVTTLSINALGDDVPQEARPGLRAWLLRQQYRVVHPYTNAAPGGWAWTDLPGGVPDADDTPGAMLALMNLESVPRPSGSGPDQSGEPCGVSPRMGDERNVRGLTPSGSPVTHANDSITAAVRWLLDLQNRDGGWPTFCRGWGTLPFDRSSPDITAHCIRALWYFGGTGWKWGISGRLFDQIGRARMRAHQYLGRSQRSDGAWLPLWFGNQFASNDENPTYGTSRVLIALDLLWDRDKGAPSQSQQRGVRWLVENQNPDGGWGAGPGTPSSIEETALAIEALVGSGEWGVGSKGTGKESELPTPHSPLPTAITAGLCWLIPRVEDGRFREPSPIGFYFAKLWYFEALYPLIFTVAALRKATAMCENEQCSSGFEPANDGN